MQVKVTLEIGDKKLAIITDEIMENSIDEHVAATGLLFQSWYDELSKDEE